MNDQAFIICFIVLLIFSIYMGFTVGSWAGQRAVTTRDYWKYNIVAIVGCVVVTALISWVPLLYAVPLGALGGGIAGLKMGFGESVGPWAVHDRVFNVNRKQREATQRGGGEDRRRRKREGAPAPDLMSVSDNSKSATATAAEDSAPSRKGGRKR